MVIALVYVFAFRFAKDEIRDWRLEWKHLDHLDGVSSKPTLATLFALHFDLRALGGWFNIATFAVWVKPTGTWDSNQHIIWIKQSTGNPPYGLYFWSSFHGVYIMNVPAGDAWKQGILRRAGIPDGEFKDPFLGPQPQGGFEQSIVPCSWDECEGYRCHEDYCRVSVPCNDDDCADGFACLDDKWACAQ